MIFVMNTGQGIRGGLHPMDEGRLRCHTAGYGENEGLRMSHIEVEPRYGITTTKKYLCCHL